MAATFKFNVFLNEELKLLEESSYPKGFSGINIRYVGVFENVKRAIMVIRYMLSLCKINICKKTSDKTLIYNGIVAKVLTWLANVANANPGKYGKYSNLFLMENSFYILEELRSM